MTRTHMLRRSALVVPVVLGVLLAGCSGDDSGSDSDSTSSETPAPSGEVPTGEEVTEDNFSFTAPEGWSDISEQAAAGGFDPLIAYAEEPPPGADFATNINVLRFEDGTEASIDELAEGAQTELEGAGYTDVEQQGRVDIDGEEAGVVSGATSANGTEYRTYQYFTIHEDGRYVITFAFPGDTALDEQASLSNGVMSTWTWA